jgi:hypothetical protein
MPTGSTTWEPISREHSAKVGSIEEKMMMCWHSVHLRQSTRPLADSTNGIPALSEVLTEGTIDSCLPKLIARGVRCQTQCPDRTHRDAVTAGKMAKKVTWD